MPEIDTQTYNKAKKYKPGHGYEARDKPPTSIIVHSTSNPHHKNTRFEAEADFLLDAALVGAHYLVGKDGRVVEFLSPRPWAAWHAGNCKVAFVNQRSIGIELHHSVGDPPYPSAQLDALADLLVSLCAEFNIPFGMVETHGQVAIKGPYQRKTDPSDWRYSDFLSFRSHLRATANKRFRVRGLPVYEQADRDGPQWGCLKQGDVIEIDDMSNGHLADGRGFIRFDPDTLEAV
jgi:N-acetyl-anhydromuramyl-L-alanine amidase AmpD